MLWDKQTKTVVNNESADIIRMFDKEFNAIAKHPHVDLSPPHLQAAINEVNEWVYPTINNGVYRCGFATKQGPYEQVLFEPCNCGGFLTHRLSKQGCSSQDWKSMG